MVSVALIVLLRDAKIVAVVWTLVDCVVTAKVALFAPAGIVTLAGTAAICGLLLANATARPPGGAVQNWPSATVPCAAEPPVTVVGFNAKE